MRTLASYGLYLGLLVAVAVFVDRLRHVERRRALPAAALGLTLVAGVVLLLTDCPWFGDLDSAYYPAGRAVLTASLIYTSDCVSGFVNIPIVAALFAPLAWFDYRVATGVFTCIGLAALAWTYVLLRRATAMEWPQALVVAALMAVAGPLWYSVREGNTTHMVFPLLLVSLIEAARRPVLSGILLATAAVVKLPLVLMGLYFLWRRQWWVVVSAAAAGVTMIVLSLLAFGLPVHESWLEACIVQPSGRPIAAFNVQSVDGLIARLAGGGLLNWTPMETGSGSRVARTLIIAGLVLWVVGALRRTGPGVTWREQLLEFSIVLVLSIVVFPVSWTHYYLLLLLPLAVLVTAPPRSPWRVATLAVAAVGVLLPLRSPPTAPDTALHLFLSVVPSSLTLIGGLLLLWVLVNERTATHT